MKKSIPVTIIILVVFFQYANHVHALCVPNQDWSSAPCYGPHYTSIVERFNQMKKDWSEYYHYKGSEWMEEKKAEMIATWKNGTLGEWRDAWSSRSTLKRAFLLLSKRRDPKY